MSDSKVGRTLFFDKELKAHVIEHEDGSITAKSHGTTVNTDSNGNLTLNLDKLRFIGMRNIPDVLEHVITRKANAVCHTIKLVNDGEVIIEYGADLKLRTFSVHNCLVQATPEGDVIIEAGNEPTS